MSSLELSSYNSVCWRSGKAGRFDVVGPLWLTEDAQSPLALDGVATAAAPLALACVKQPKRELMLWLSWKGPRNFHKSPTAFHSVLQVCTEDTHLGIFYTQRHDQYLSFALFEHAKGDVERLVGVPRVYATEVAALMDDVMSEGERKERIKNASKSSCFAVRHATLRRTARGYVVAAVVVTEKGGVYGVVGDLEANVWRKWKVHDSSSSSEGSESPCIFISAGGADVRFVRCGVETPIDADAAAVAPSVSLALSNFDRVSAADVNSNNNGGNRGDAATGSSPSSSSAAPRAVCAVLRECVVPTRSGTCVAERCYQSHPFQLTEDRREEKYGDGRWHCLAVVEDKSLPMYTLIFNGPQQTGYVVHVTYTMGGGELVSAVTAVPDLRKPICVCSLRLPTHPQRPGGTTLSLVLCRDMKLYACEHFGQSAMTVALRINNLRSSTVTFSFPLQLKPLKKRISLSAAAAAAGGMDEAADGVHLVAVHGGTEVVCTNGVVGVFFRVSAVELQTPAPAVCRAAITNAAEDFADLQNNVSSDDRSGGAAALQECLSKLEALSLCTTRHDLPDVIFRDVLPRLRYVGTSQQEVMLVQRVYERLLHMADPNLQSEWEYLWALTTVLQRTLAKRNRDNGVLYTDAFFMRLADTYCRSDFATAEGTAAVADAVRASVSDEAARVLSSHPVELLPEVHYVLDGLAEGVSLIDLAEEVARCMVHTNTLSNGTCVVSAHPGKAACVHAMGCVLLASCLDITVYVCAQSGCEVHVCVQPPQHQAKKKNNSAVEKVEVPLCVAVSPFTFQTQGDFEKALTLAADLLCVSTDDASFRPDIALLTLAIGTRQHCLTALVQLFAPVLRSALNEVSPLSENTAWLEACATALPRDFAAQATALLAEGRNSGMTLTTTLAYILYAPQQIFNLVFFGVLSSTLTEEFCTTALVACVFHQTERLVAAVHNYAAAVSVQILTKTNETQDDEAAGQAVQVGRRRLRATLTQTYALWAHMGTLSPYRVEDVAASYRISARNSLASSSISESATATGEETTTATAAAQASRGTVASRTLVLCFRLLCLAQFCCDSEDVMRPSSEVGSTIGNTGNDDANATAGRCAESCTQALQTLYLLREAPLPLEWFQRAFVSLVESVAAQQPTQVSLLVRLLELSSVRQTNNARLKKMYYRVLDKLQDHMAQWTHSSMTETAREELRRARGAVESAVTALTLLDEVPEQHRGGSSGAAGLNGALSGTPVPSTSSTVHFVFSSARDPTLPRWRNQHALPERRYLFSHEWTDVLWTLEKVPEALLAATEATVRCIVQVPVSVAGDPAETPQLSMEMANPLFAHLCRLRPPVRMHVIPTHCAEATSTATSEPSVAQHQQKSAAVTTQTLTANPTEKLIAQHNDVVTPEKLRATREVLEISTPPTPPPTPQATVGQAAAVPIVAVAPVVALEQKTSLGVSVRPATFQQNTQLFLSRPTPTLHMAALPSSLVAHDAPLPTAEPQKPDVTPTSAPTAAPALPKEEKKEAFAHFGMYAPADVAWWDSVGLCTSPTPCRITAAPTAIAVDNAAPPAKETPLTAAEVKDTSVEVAVHTATGDDNGESSDTATSYTTSTSNYADPIAGLNEFGRRTVGDDRELRKGVRYRNSDSTSRSVEDGYDTPRRVQLAFYSEQSRMLSPRSSPTPTPRCSQSIKKKCRCCHRTVHRHREHRSGGGGPKMDDAGAFALRWSDGPVIREVSPLRPPLTQPAATARPTLLSFATRLQPPEEPSRFYVQTARVPPQSLSDSPACPSPVALLRLPTTSSATQVPSRVRLYTLHGERVEAADGDSVLTLRRGETVSCGGDHYAAGRGVLSGRAAQLAAPVVPPSSVFVAPPALLRLPQQQQQQQEQGGSPQWKCLPVPSPSAQTVATASPVSPLAVAAEVHSYPQAARAPVGPAPSAVDLSTYYHPSNNDVQSQWQQQGQRSPPNVDTPVPPAVPISTPLPVPAPPPATPTCVLTPAQMTDFQRYTDNLLARQSASAADQTSSTNLSGAAGPPAPTSTTAAATTAEAQSPGAAQTNNTSVSDYVTADSHSLTRLVQQQEDFIRKAEALMQVRQAENEGFYRRVVESIRSLTAASQPLRGLTPTEQSQLVRDTVKQRNELMTLNHQLLEMQLAAARVSGVVSPLSPSPSQHRLETLSAMPLPRSFTPPLSGTTQKAQTPPTATAPTRLDMGVSCAATAPSLTSVPTQTPATAKMGMQDALSDLQRLNTELMGVSASAEAMDRAINETREVIQRYERSKTAEALSAEGVALTTAMRLRTAAIEQRLSELPRGSSQPQQEQETAVATLASRAWSEQSSSLLVELGMDDKSAAAAAGSAFSDSGEVHKPNSTVLAAAMQQTVVASTPSLIASSPKFTAHRETRENDDDRAEAEKGETQPVGGTPQHRKQLQLPPPSAVVNTLQPFASPQPSQMKQSGAALLVTAGSTSPTFTSVSSAPLDATATTTRPPPAAPVFAASRQSQQQRHKYQPIDNCDDSPSISFSRTRPASSATPCYPFHSEESRLARHNSENEGDTLSAQSSAPALVFTKPCDLRTLFTAAGGSVGQTGAHTPPNAPQRVRSVGAAAHRPSSLVPKATATANNVTHTPHRTKAPTAATGSVQSSREDRFAMYRVPLKPQPQQQVRQSVNATTGPSSCLPLAYTHSNPTATTSISGGTTEDVRALPKATVDSTVLPRRALVGSVYSDRQLERRLTSIAQRMQQLEHDLFD